MKLSSSSKPVPKNEGFQVLKVKYDENSTVLRHVFVKQFVLNYHKNLNEDKPENRTLFMINVPPFVTEHHIRHLFGRCGKIKRIFLQEKPSLASASSVFNKIQCLSENQTEESSIESVTKYLELDQTIMSYKVCYVVFNKAISLTNALKMTEEETVFTLKPSDTVEGYVAENFYTGIKLWQKQYNDSIVSPGTLKKVATNFLEDYQTKAEKSERLEKEMADSGPDSQGWVTVNRKLRRDRRALVADKFHDIKLKEMYEDRAIKRLNEEHEFEQQIDPLIQAAVKKKKSKKNIEF